MTVLIVVAVAAVCAAAGFFAGVRTTARNADRLLAVMSDAQIVQTARKARLRRELLGSAGDTAGEPREPTKVNLVPRRPDRPNPGREGG